ncbi:conserved hypothetical protein [Ruegeria lacuscaerulensis ITI-1157]|nr:conserved hypothetical protein [Ruegeria lacuscaerulensis ITI-1157]
MLVLVATFVTLVPGGPIETRDFSGLGRAVFWGFNAFLIALAVLAVGSAVAMLRGSVAASWGALVAAWGYIFVVLLDLGHVFPTSPDPVSLMLGLVEILDFILALYVMALAHRGLGHA